MNYKGKQRTARLETWYICHKLGIKFNEWKEVRCGKRSLSSDKLDLFNELTYSESNEWINQEQEKRKIDEWYENQTQESLKSKFKEFNINQMIVADDIGCDTSTICKIISNPNKDESNIKYLIYYYLNDEFNRRGNYKTSKIRKQTKRVEEDKNNIEETKEEVEEKVEIKTEDIPIHTDTEEVWYNEFQMMANKYHETKEELDRYKFLIDELRKKQNSIEGLGKILNER